jgi:predicted acyl esterase
MALLAALACAVAILVPAPADALPEGSTFQQYQIPSGDGTLLDVDVIRAEGTPADERQPVIMVVSPYTLPENNGPSRRFDDFFAASGAIHEGYTYAIATLRSFGQSEGCSDWGGPGEQMDVVAAVEWAAKQPWSNGRVGLLGKSYDGWTGLMGMANRPEGLAAVLSMEPVFDGYRYLYDDGIRFVNSVLTPTSFMTTDPPTCAVEYFASQQDDNRDSAFWQQRELIEKSKGSMIPLFLTQGFLERNTKPDGAFEYWNGIEGPKRAWFGQFDHVRGYEIIGGQYATGRETFIDQAMDFYDAFLKLDPEARARFDAAPQVEVQDSQGHYHGEASWPPPDAVIRRSTLNFGVYQDNGLNFGSRDGFLATAPAAPNTGLGVWSISQPMPGVRRMTGEPVLDLDLITTAPRANVAANVYDIAPDGSAVLVSRGADLIRLPGPQRHRLTLYGQDWVFEKDHRIGVLVSGSNNEWWVHEPTNSPVVVSEAFAELPILREERTEFLEGEETARLRSHLNNAKITVPAQVIQLFETPFDVG